MDQGATDEIGGELARTYARLNELFAEKKYAEMVVMCEQAERAGRYDANIVAAHSASLLKLNRPVEVVSLLESMLYYFPNDARLHMNLGTAYGATFRRAEYKREYEIARQLDPAMVGQKVTRLAIIRIVLGAVSFAAFFAALIFWPHTRWLLVGLTGVMICVSVFILIAALRAQVKKLIGPLLMLAFWVIVLFVAIFLPVR